MELTDLIVAMLWFSMSLKVKAVVVGSIPCIMALDILALDVAPWDK